MAGLKALFDYHRFEGNQRLAVMIREAESRYGSRIGIDGLELISAAGDVNMKLDENDK